MESKFGPIPGLQPHGYNWSICADGGKEYDTLRGPCPFCADPEHMLMPDHRAEIAEANARR